LRGIAVFFIYGIFAQMFDSIGENIFADLLSALFIYGSCDGIKRIIKQCKNKR